MINTFEEAVREAKLGNNDGFTFLYEQTYYDKYYLALKYMGNEQDTQDVLQDAYIRAWNNINTLNEADKFSGWLGKIVANTAKNALAKKNPVLFSDLSQETDDGCYIEYEVEDDRVGVQPELNYTIQETQQFLYEMLGALSDEQRMCILMYHIEGQKIKDIAEALGCSENTVKSRLTYGRNALRSKCEEMRSKGYRLYSMAPIPVLMYFIMQESSAYGATGVSGALWSAIGAGSRATGAAIGIGANGGASDAVIKTGINRVSSDVTIVTGANGGVVAGNVAKDVVTVGASVTSKIIILLVTVMVLAAGACAFLIYNILHEDETSDTITESTTEFVLSEETIDEITEDVSETTTEVVVEENSEIDITALYGYPYSVVLYTDYDGHNYHDEPVTTESGVYGVPIKGTITYFDYMDMDKQGDTFVALSGTTYNCIGTTEPHGNERYEYIYTDGKGNEFTSSDAVYTGNIDPVTGEFYKALFLDGKCVAHTIENVEVVVPFNDKNGNDSFLSGMLPSVFIINFDENGDITYVTYDQDISYYYENCIIMD